MKILIVDNYAVLIVVQIKVIDLLNKGGYFLNMFYNESMKLPRIHIWTSVLAGIFMAVASAAGIFLSSTYLKESSFWAAQGTGQDYINLFIVFPALLISAYLISKGSIRALLIWLGLLIYIAYSYVLYSFFVTFGPLFLVYVATLGFAFYALLGGTISLVR